MAKMNRKKRRTGFAYTKKVPHKNHPAYYRKKENVRDDIEYVTFTHSSNVKFSDKDVVEAEPLKYDIDYKNKGDKRYSHVVKRVFDGKRSALGKDTTDYRLDEEDRLIVDEVFKTAPRRRVAYTGSKEKDGKKPSKCKKSKK